MVTKHLPQPQASIEGSFSKMAKDDKWVSSSGAIVDDRVYDFAKTCIVDHPSCSWIVDTDDITLPEKGVFTEEEMQEIGNKEPLQTEQKLPKDIEYYLSCFNRNNLKNLRSELSRNHTWERNYNQGDHHNLDWIKHTMHSYTRLFESDALKSTHKEQWYNKKVWLTIDTIFDDTPSIVAEPGEIASASNRERKNACLNHLVKPTKHCVLGFFNCIASKDTPANKELYTFGDWNNIELFDLVKGFMPDIVDIYSPTQVTDWLSKDDRFGYSTRKLHASVAKEKSDNLCGLYFCLHITTFTFLSNLGLQKIEILNF